MKKHVIIVGGGTAGCVAAGKLAREGIRVSLIEKEDHTGGKINNWFQLSPDRRDGDEVIRFIENELDNPLIDVRCGETIKKIKKEKGLFSISDSKEKLEAADALLIASGFDLFEASRKEEYAYGIFDDVITSAEMEVMFRSGEVKCADGRIPDRIGFVHCVGSRDEKVGNFHCSKLCCVTAVKQAIEVKEYLPSTEVFCFYTDMRMFGLGYEELYIESQEKWGVNYIRGKVSETGENDDGRLVVMAEDTLTDRLLKMELDMLVLMVGMENSRSGLELKSHLNLDLGVNGFFKVKDMHFGTNMSETEGVFFAGTCTAPMNISDTITHARSAAVEICNYLNK